MSALVSSTPPVRHVVGDTVVRFYNLAAVVPSDTLQVPQVNVYDVIITPTTAVATGATWAGANNGTLITFAGTWAGRVAVWSKSG